MLSYSLYNRASKEALWNEGIPDPQSYFGSAVALDTMHLVVSASGGYSQAGKVIVYPNGDGTGFSSSVKYILQPTGLPAGSGFGNSLSLHGGYLAVGCSSYLDYSGSVYFYALDGNNNFAQQQVISNPKDPAGATIDTMSGSEFSDSVWIDSNSDTLLVSAPNYKQSDGLVLVYLRVSGSWEQKFTIPGPTALKSYFGSPLAASSSVLAVSAIRAPHGTGAFGSVFVYTRDDFSSSYSQQQELTALSAGGATGIYSFGNSLAMTASYLFVGTGQTGAVFVFQYQPGVGSSGGSFVYSQRLGAPGGGGSPLPYFGYTMAAQGNIAAMGQMSKSILDHNSQKSGVYVYDRDVSTAAGSASKVMRWSVLQYISPAADDNSQYEYFGSAVGLASDGTLAATNVGPLYAKGNMLLFSPTCPAGSYVQIQPSSGVAAASSFCVQCPAGSYDSSGGVGLSLAACVPCPAAQSGTPAGSASCLNGSARPSRPPTPAPSLRPTAPSPPPTTANQFSPTSNPTLIPTAAVTPPSPQPTSHPLVTKGVPTAVPTLYPSTADMAPIFTKKPSPLPTKRPSAGGEGKKTRPTNSLSTNTSPASSEPDDISKTTIALSSIAVVVLMIMAVLCYRRYLNRLRKEETDLEAASNQAASAEDAANNATIKAKQKRLSAYEKWCVYEDAVRARRISNMFTSSANNDNDNGDVTPHPPAAGGAGAGSGSGSTRLSPGTIELRDSRTSRSSAGGRLSLGGGLSHGPALENRLSISAMPGGSGRLSLGASPVGSTNSSPPPRSSRGSFSNLGGLFSPEFDVSSSASSASGGSQAQAVPIATAAAEVVGTDLANLDEDLRKSLVELEEAELPPITLAEAAAAMQGALSGSDTGVQVINPLMGGALPPGSASITAIRAAQSGPGRRLSVAAATRVGNPLFNPQVRRASLNTRLGLANPPPGSVAVGTLAQGETLATGVVQSLSDVTPPSVESIMEERPSELGRPSEM